MSLFAKESYAIDHYNCARLDFDTLVKYVPCVESANFDQFECMLIETSKKWKEDNLKASWFKVPLKYSSFIPILVKNGFVYHHARTEFVMMLKWFSDGVYNIPNYAFTNIGVGGIVLDENDHVLVVKERHNFGKPFWKFPGGFANPREEFGDTAEREVFEETGIKTKFQSLIVLRHSDKSQFECSDIYILCSLKPVKDENNPNLETKMCAQELTDIAWIPAKELKPHLSPFNLFAFEKFLSYREKKIIIGLDKVDSVFKQFGKQSVYSIKFEEQQ
ncbi:NUDIX hydrolase-like protein [Dinothrombium tinctorium]|uniref:NUDIX hydrolase-like protein n=1 Tax=Dinothrombium tinctorium TaxID=1965070 RepID=A0A3S3P4L3_9ACAR|nr:NUDIX hydrolase-like protein [Dinothrombium tinctorium]